MAAGFALINVALAIMAWRRQVAIGVTAVVPLLALASVPLVYRFWPRISAPFRRCAGCGSFAGSSVVPVLLLAAVPAVLLVLVSLFKTMMIARGFMLFVPFLLVVQAAGIEALARRRLPALLLLALLAAVHLYSVDYFRRMPGPADYRELARAMDGRMETGDLVFVYPRDWVTTPLYYYFQERQDRFVARDYAAELGRHPAARVWIPLFDGYKEPSEDMRTALQGYRRIERVTAHACAADLYVPARE